MLERRKGLWKELDWLEKSGGHRESFRRGQEFGPGIGLATAGARLEVPFVLVSYWLVGHCKHKTESDWLASHPSPLGHYTAPP